MTDESAFAFAGIWDSWGTGERIRSCAIITTAANETVQPVHERMPVILRPENYRLWLDPQTDSGSLVKLLAPYPAATMSADPVGSAVNFAENDGPELISGENWEIGTNLNLF